MNILAKSEEKSYLLFDQAFEGLPIFIQDDKYLIKLHKRRNRMQKEFVKGVLRMRVVEARQGGSGFPADSAQSQFRQGGREITTAGAIQDHDVEKRFQALTPICHDLSLAAAT